MNLQRSVGLHLNQAVSPDFSGRSDGHYALYGNRAVVLQNRSLRHPEAVLLRTIAGAGDSEHAIRFQGGVYGYRSFAGHAQYHCPTMVFGDFSRRFYESKPQGKVAFQEAARLADFNLAFGKKEIRVRAGSANYLVRIDQELAAGLHTDLALAVGQGANAGLGNGQHRRPRDHQRNAAHDLVLQRLQVGGDDADRIASRGIVDGSFQGSELQIIDCGHNRRCVFDYRAGFILGQQDPGGDVVRHVALLGLVTVDHLERAARDGNHFIGRRPWFFRLVRIVKGVRLYRCGAIGSFEDASIDLHRTQILVSIPFYNGDRCTVAYDAVVFCLFRFFIRNRNAGPLTGHVQCAGAHLHANVLGVDHRVFNGNRTRAGEIDAVSIFNIEGAFL